MIIVYCVSCCKAGIQESRNSWNEIEKNRKLKV